MTRWVLVFFLASSASVVTADLRADVNTIIKSQPGVEFSVCIIDGATGKTIYDHRAKEALTPASNMKIVTSAVALQYLGPDYEYVTRVGLVNGSLAVIGSGDPLLGDPESDELQGRDPGEVLCDIGDRIVEQKIHRVKEIIVDSTVFDNERVHPSWPEDELNKAYSAEVCGINYYGNCIGLTLTRQGRRVELVSEPDTTFLNITNDVKAISQGSQAVAALRKIGNPNHIVLRGKVRSSQGVDLAIEKPAAYFGFLLAEELHRRGVRIEGKVVETALPSDVVFRLLAEYRTPLKIVLRRCNKDSFNLAAEALLKTVAAHATEGRRNGSWRVGQSVAGTFLESLGIPDDEYVIDDASGLSDRNRLSARALATTLYEMYQGDCWSLYKETLAVGGRDGTLYRYSEFREPPYQGNILGKTGYIGGVKSFSGVCFVDDHPYFFSILTNRTRGDTRRAINRIALAIVDNG
jgi:D-alanyl-D-alanine carboxypeptidase/D-alanyl-D-alanine-endopeptidase (penicillin-binding protein 4)